MERLASLVRQAGFPEAEVPRMVAVAMAESGGNPRAHNPNAATGDNSYGLLQVNMLGQMGDERRRAFGLNSNEDLFDPLTNLKAARRIYESQGIGAWGAWTNGSASKYLEAARKAAGSPASAAGAFDGGSPGTGGGGTAGDAASGALLTALLQDDDAPAGGGTSSVATARPQTVGDAVSDALGGGMRFAGGGSIGAAAAAVMSRPTRLPQLPVLDDAGGGEELAQVLGRSVSGGGSAPSAAPASTSGAAAGAGGTMPLPELLRGIQDAGKLRIGEHPEFGTGRVGKHSPNSHHYAGHAADITDWNDDVTKAGDWKARTAAAGKLARQIFGNSVEVFDPGYDPVGGHHSHLHFAVPGGHVDRQLASRYLAMLPGVLGRSV